jgi:hypothetical protein
MKVNDLKKELKARGLSVTGNKTELIERLQVTLPDQCQGAYSLRCHPTYNITILSITYKA